MSAVSNLIALQIGSILRNHCRQHDQGWLFAVSGEDVIPGFRCKVEDFFPKPPPAEAHRPTASDVVSPSPAS